jgi:hypothetical protein
MLPSSEWPLSFGLSHPNHVHYSPLSHAHIIYNIIAIRNAKRLIRCDEVLMKPVLQELHIIVTYTILNTTRLLGVMFITYA